MNFHPWPLVALLLFVGCDSSGGTVTDGGQAVDAVAEGDSTPPANCEIPFSDALSLAEGGRLAVPREGAFSAEDLAVETSDGLTVTLGEDSLVFYSEYGAAEAQDFSWSSNDCDPGMATIQVRALAWNKLSEWDPAVSGPPAREYGAWWPTESGVFVFGGFHYVPEQFTPANDLWFFDFASSAWSEIATTDAPLSPGGRAVLGPEPGLVHYHGGSMPRANGSLSTPSLFRTLRFDSTPPVWETPPNAEGAPGSYTGSLIYDAARERWLSVCGLEGDIHCRISEYTAAGGWRNVFIEGLVPPGRYGFHYGFDEASQRLAVVGGQTGPGATDISGDTWVLDLSTEPPTWEMLFAEDPMVKRRNGAFVFDPEGRRLILWGGTPDGSSANEGLSILRFEPGHERWDHVETPDDVRPRASAYAVFDAPRRRAIGGFGNSSEGLFTDLYELSL